MINGVLKMNKIVFVMLIVISSMIAFKQNELIVKLRDEIKTKDMEKARQSELIKQLNNEIVLYQDLEQLKDELGKYQEGLKN